MLFVWHRLARRTGGLPSWLLWVLGISSLLNLTSGLSRIERDSFSWVVVGFSAFLLFVVVASFLAKRQGRSGIED